VILSVLRRSAPVGGRRHVACSAGRGSRCWGTAEGMSDGRTGAFLWGTGCSNRMHEVLGRGRAAGWVHPQHTRFGRAPPSRLRGPEDVDFHRGSS